MQNNFRTPNTQNIMFQWFLARTMTMMMIDLHIFFLRSFFALFFICGRQLLLLQKWFSFFCAYCSRSNGLTFHRSIRSLHMAQHVYSPAMNIRLCTQFTFDILIKIFFSQWSAAKLESISENQRIAFTFRNKHILMYVEYEVSTWIVNYYYYSL